MNTAQRTKHSSVWSSPEINHQVQGRSTYHEISSKVFSRSICVSALKLLYYPSQLYKVQTTIQRLEIPLLSEQAKTTESETTKQIVFRHGRDFNYTGGETSGSRKVSIVQPESSKTNCQRAHCNIFEAKLQKEHPLPHVKGCIFQQSIHSTEER